MMVLEAVMRGVASGADRHIDIGLQSSSLVSILFREAFSHPYISFFHLLVNGLSVTCRPPFFFYLNEVLRLNYILALPQCPHNATQNLPSFP